MMKPPRLIIAPEEYQRDKDRPAIFLAGGITGCPDWQAEIAPVLLSQGWDVLNPRRAIFPMNDPEAAQEQIEWEFRHLRYVDVIAFWFPRESICPIALYELGAWTVMGKPIFIGIDFHYPRKQDIEIQTRLIKPHVRFCYSLAALAQEVGPALDHCDSDPWDEMY